MASAAVVITNKKKEGNRSSCKLISPPSWYPWDGSQCFNEEQVSTKVGDWVIKVQAHYRGYSVRKYIARNVFTSVLTTRARLRVVLKNILKMSKGMATADTIAAGDIHVDYSIRHILEGIQTADGKSYLEVKSLEDLNNYVVAATTTLYSPDPIYSPPSNCQLVQSDNCDQANSILLNQTRLDEFIKKCSVSTPGAGFITLDTTSMYWTAIIQTRRTKVPCKVSKSMDSNYCFSNDPEDTFVAANVAANGSITSPNLNTTIGEFGKDQFEAEYFSGRVPQFISFVPSGFLNLDAQLVKCKSRNLVDIEWIGRGMNSVCIHNSYINSNQNGVVGTYSICFSSSLTGDVTGDVSVTSSPINTSTNSFTNIDAAVTIIYAVMVSLNAVYLLLHTTRKYIGFLVSRCTKRKSKWDWGQFLVVTVDYTSVGLQYACIGTFFVYFNKSVELFDDILSRETPDEISEYLTFLEFFQISYGELVTLYTRLYALWSVTILLTTYRTISMLAFHPDTALITETLRRCWQELCAFAFVFFLMVCGYALVFTVRYGTDVEEFATVGRSMNGLLLSCFSQFDAVISILDIGGFFDVLVVWSFVFLTTLLLLNILLSIVVEAFLRFHDQRREEKFLSFTEAIHMSFQLFWFDMRHYWIQKSLSICIPRYSINDLGHEPPLPYLDEGLKRQLATGILKSSDRLKLLMVGTDYNMTVYSLRNSLDQLFSLSVVEKIFAQLRLVPRDEEAENNSIGVLKRMVASTNTQVLTMCINSRKQQTNDHTETMEILLKLQNEVQDLKFKVKLN